MSEWKEVWYVWDKESVIHDTKHVLRDDGKVINLYGAAPLGGMDIDKRHVSAYTLGQKRRRVVCTICGGSGFNDDVFNDQGIESDCVVCNGTGKVWEYSE